MTSNVVLTFCPKCKANFSIPGEILKKDPKALEKRQYHCPFCDEVTVIKKLKDGEKDSGKSKS
jgi:hypothetical protein